MSYFNSPLRKMCLLTHPLPVIPDPASLRNVYYNDVPKTVYTDGWFTGGNDFLDLTLRGGDPRRRLKWPRVFEEATGALPDNLVGLANRMDIPQLRPVEPPLDKACRPKFTKTTTSPKSGTEAYHKPLAWRLMTDTVEQLLEANRHKGLTFPRPTTKKTRVDYKVFVGNGDATCQDNELRFAAVVHPLGSHGGIPGWKRISMVAFKKPESGSARRGYLDAKEEDFRITMTYEGVILPTGAVMLGYCRKRFEDNTYSDSIPFVYWSVCRPLEDDEDDDGDNRDSEEHAFHFQDMIARGEAEDRRDELEWAMAMEAARNRS